MQLLHSLTNMVDYKHVEGGNKIENRLKEYFTVGKYYKHDSDGFNVISYAR